jgi:hypothetical protein
VWYELDIYISQVNFNAKQVMVEVVSSLLLNAKDGFQFQLVHLEFLVVKLTKKRVFIRLCRQLAVVVSFSVFSTTLRLTLSTLHTRLQLIYLLVINFEKNIYLGLHTLGFIYINIIAFSCHFAV